MEELPVRIVAAPLTEPVVFVDGLPEPRERAVLELSHWPGNRTPARFRDDLSSGAALRFAAEDPATRAELTRGAAAVVNDHYDTDGCLALFVLYRPRLALPRRRAILEAAAAGDFFHWPSDDALALDAIVTELSRSPQSPIASTTEGTPDLGRWNVALRFLLDRLPALLDGDLGDLRPLAAPALERAHQDRAWLATAERTEVESADLCVWARSERADDAERLPGRHALLGATERDRVLLLVETPDGLLARWLASTRSWFELRSPAPRPRPDLESVVARLNELEGSTPEEVCAWRSQPGDGPSPELWFGLDGLPPFPEHNTLLRPSRLAATQVRALLAS